MNTLDDIEIETHPWEPFIPEKARVLIMGTFPPQAKRWSMDFFYPNPTNDFWFMMGLLFEGDKDAFFDRANKRFKLDKIKELLTKEQIAMFDTAYKVRRLKGNASDKYLEIVEPVGLKKLLAQMPSCKTLATTGEKAAAVIAKLTETALPGMGEFVESFSGLTIWRMPSTSRAYPMKLEVKAQYYKKLFDSL